MSLLDGLEPVLHLFFLFCDLVENDRSNEIKMEALSILHEEAMKSFSRGSKAAADFVEAYSRRVAKS